MRGLSNFFFSRKRSFQQQPKQTPPASEQSSEHPKVYREVLGQIAKEMELQINKIFDYIDKVKRDLQYRLSNVRHHLEALETRIEELSVQLNMLSAKQSAAEYNARARDQNSLVTSREMYICPLRNPETNDDVRCPSTLGELEAYSGSELDALLHALGEPVPTATNHKLEIIKWALGIRNGRYK
ncbi:hypothetical protein ACSS6W_006602 [Trichoderma asperelloides]|nr:hypothetical protein LI328DRAFT_161909 [Trichoderma asperelloides]